MRIGAGGVGALGFALLGCAATPVPAVSAAAERGEIVFYDYRLPAQQVGELSARFDDGGGERIVSPSEFRIREFGFPSSVAYPTRNAGTLRVTVALRHRGQLSEGLIELPLRPDWRHGIAIHLTGGGPPGGCMGCIGGRGFLLAAPIGSATHLFIEWGGNSISAPLPA